jgi:hypothetical protein
MSTVRARHPEQVLPPEPLLVEPLMTVNAGESVVIRVGALDRQSGVSEIIVQCQSRENQDLRSSGRWSLRIATQPADNYYPVVVHIPSHSPTVMWELHQVTLSDGGGNCRTYVAGKDFDEILFQVQGRSGVDCTPPRLLGLKIGRA